jgi:hypothetical protein
VVDPSAAAGATTYRLFDDRLIARLRARANDPRFAPAAEALRTRADDACHATRLPTAAVTGWTHNFQCPKHSVALRFDESSPHEHACPVDGERFTGPKLDQAWNALYFRAVLGDATAAAHAYAAFDDHACFERAKQILLTWADLYPGYTPHGINAGKGRCMGQSLDEAVWIVDLGKAYDLARPAMSPGDRARFEDNLLRPCGEHLLTQLRRDIHNIECWHLAGLVTIGRLLGEDRFIKPALEGEYAIDQQLTRGFLPDGWWWEGSPTYHYYTLEAIRGLVHAIGLGALGGESVARIRRAFDAPLELSRADASLPALNDGWVAAAMPGHVFSKTDSYEWASHTLQDPHYAELLAHCYDADHPRASLAAIVYGPDTLPTAAPIARRSTCHATSGYGVLRHTTPAGEIWAMLKFGPHGGGHGHADKPALLLHAFGHRFSDDLGTPGYGAPLNTPWFRHTLAHSAPLINQAPQPPVEGRLVRFDDAAASTHALVEVDVSWPNDGVYSGVQVRRLLILRLTDTPYLIDVVRVRTPSPTTIDLPLHHAGTLHTPAASVEPLAADGAYQFLTDWRALGQCATARIDTGTSGSVIWLAGGDAYAARSPDNPSDHTRTTLLRRSRGREALFATIISPFDGQPIDRSVRWIRVTPDAVAFVIEGDNDAWAIASSDAGLAVTEAELRGAILRTHLFAD